MLVGMGVGDGSTFTGGHFIKVSWEGVHCSSLSVGPQFENLFEIKTPSFRAIFATILVLDQILSAPDNTFF